MNKRNIYSFSGLSLLLIFIWMFSGSGVQQDDFSGLVKISLREVGHQLLLENQDSTSLVLPVVALENSKYQLSFQEHLFIEPDSLVAFIKTSFNRNLLPSHYRVEVIKCSDNEVAYSYEVKDTTEKGIIPCGGRNLPENCYLIEVKFLYKDLATNKNKYALLVFLLIAFIAIMIIFRKKKRTNNSEESNDSFNSIGRYRFYPDQNKLVKEAIEISLSKKECELLAIFVANPNQIIKRDELTKKVWEDNGVIVGRSLDTYISKLRKKLKDDDSIKLTNVHGVGYKLEIE